MKAIQEYLSEAEDFRVMSQIIRINNYLCAQKTETNDTYDRDKLSPQWE
jgi:hypothetical protein